MFRKVSAIVLPLLVVALFLLPLLFQGIATGQNGREIEIEIGKFDPKKAKAKLRQAYSKHFDDKDFDAAIAAYQAVIERFPNSEQATEAQFRIANIHHWDKKQPQEAIKAYQVVIEKYPASSIVAEAMMRMGSVYHWDVKDYNKAISVYEQMLSKYPKSDQAAETQLWIAEAYGGLKQYDKGIEAYQKVVEKYPESDFAPEAQVRIGNGLFRELKDLEGAKTAHEKLIAQYPESHCVAEARYYLGRYHMGKGDNEKAIQEFEIVLQKYPEKISPSYSAVKMLEWLGATAQQKEIIAAYYQKYPDYCRQAMSKGVWDALIAQWKLAIFYLDGCERNPEMLDLAMQEFQTFLDKYPSHRYAAAAMLELAHGYRSKGEYNKSIEICQQIIKQYPERILADKARHLIGANYHQQGKLKEAIQAEEEVLRASSHEREKEIAKRRISKYTNLLEQ